MLKPKHKSTSALLLILGLCLMLSACATNDKTTATDVVAISDVPEQEYQSVIKKFSRDTKQYDGFHQTFGATVTLLNSEVNMLILQRRGHFLGWSEEEMREEREKSFQEMSAYSKVFLSFFSPNNEVDDLHRPDSIWKIYLEYNGQRYEGKIKKDTSKRAELQQLYTHMDRFHTPYIVSFEVPMSSVEQTNSKLVITSSLGTASFEFPPVSSR